MKKILVLLVVAGAYWLILAKPGLYFNKSAEYRGFTLYAHGSLPEKTDIVLDKVYDKISTSDFYTPEMKFNIYLTGGRGEFSFFTPLLHGEYVRVSPLGGAIYVAAADFAADEVRTAPGAPAHRPLSAELVRAAAREMTRRILEPLSYLVMSEWKLRGYSERLSGGTGEYQPADICKSDDPAMLDFKYGLALDYAIKVDGVSMRELMTKEYAYEKLEEGVKKQNCGG